MPRNGMDAQPITAGESKGVRMYYDQCLKCRKLDTRPEAQCNCPKRTKEQIKAQANQLMTKRSSTGSCATKISDTEPVR
jgi:hypothetical protein